MVTPNNLVIQLFVDGAWTSYPGYAEDGWDYQIGPDLTAGSQPNRFGVTLNNDDLSMDPSNVTSPLYEKIGRNTKARLRLNGTTCTQAEASSWQPDATVEHVPGVRGRASTDLTAEGLLHRLGQWTDPTRSAMTRQAVSLNGVLGYFTLEDPSGAAQLSNETPGGSPGPYSGTVTLQGDDGAGGADGAVKIGVDGQLAGGFLTSAGNGYQISWAAKLAAIPATATALPLMAWGDAQRRTWVWQVDSTGHSVTVIDSVGTVLGSTSFSFGGFNPTQWTRYRVKVTVSGGTVTYEPAIYLQDAISPAGVTATFASTTAGRPYRWTVSGNAHTDGAAFNHVLVTTDTTVSLLTGDYAGSFNGYLGERAASRFWRLMGEAGLTRYIQGDQTLTAPMGRQKPGVLLDLIEECLRSEAGLLYDEPEDVALTFVTNRALVNRTPLLTLAKSQLTYPLKKTIDDVGVTNDVTVKNADGSTANVTLDTGALSVQPPPAGVGRVKSTIEVNLAGVAPLADRANWEMRKATLSRPRYQQVNVDLLGNPGIKTTVTLTRPGDWLALTGVEPDTVMLRIISVNRSGGAVTDKITFNCLPAELYICGVYSAASSRYDSATTTLAAAITTTGQTSIALTTSNAGEVWSTTSLPYDVVVKGERMTVTAMTAPAGTGPYTQTATVTRGVNGVHKLHAAGAPFSLFAPVRYALG